jgi:hypothetical protein
MFRLEALLLSRLIQRNKLSPFTPLLVLLFIGLGNLFQDLLLKMIQRLKMLVMLLIQLYPLCIIKGEDDIAQNSCQ